MFNTGEGTSWVSCSFQGHKTKKGCEQNHGVKQVEYMEKKNMEEMVRVHGQEG